MDEPTKILTIKRLIFEVTIMRKYLEYRAKNEQQKLVTYKSLIKQCQQLLFEIASNLYPS